MGRRKSQPESDSLDLLLDTICNMFGGIILMAILVIVQTHVSAARIPAAAAATESPDVSSLRREEARLRDRRQGLERQLAGVKGLVQGAVSPDLGEVLDTRAKYMDAIQRAEKDLADRRAEAQQVRQDVGKARDAAGDLEEQARKLTQQSGELKQRLAELRTRPPKGVRLPHQRQARGTPRYYVVCKDRVYRNGAGAAVRWTGEPYVQEDCSVTPSNSLLLPSVAVRPRPNAGLPVAEESGRNSPFLDSLRAYPPSTYYVVFFLYDDSKSFASFQELKNQALSRGYLYVVGSKPPDEECIILYPGGHRTE